VEWITIFQVDAFTDEPFRGNPAGVCFLETERGEDWMQAVAREMNLSETAFLVPQDDGYRLRWFTPAAEVDLCGHATLASAHALRETGRASEDAELHFHTLSGLLTARRTGKTIELNFPSEPPSACSLPAGMAEALGVDPIWTGANRIDFLVEIKDAEELSRIQPDFRALKALTSRGVMVTCRSDREGFDFLSRFFAPAVGVDEDPVTGSAHCCLGPYWKEKTGRNIFTAFQASSRGGTVRVRVLDDRVILGGMAVTVLKGEVLCPKK